MIIDCRNDRVSNFGVGMQKFLILSMMVASMGAGSQNALAIVGLGKHKFKAYSPKFADTVQIDDKELVLNGVGLRKALWIKIYMGALYLEEKSQDPTEIIESERTKHIVMHFLKGISKDRLGSEFRSSFMKNCDANCEEKAKFIDDLAQKMADLKQGDELKITVKKDRILFQAPGKDKPLVSSDQAIAKTILKIFIRPTKEPEELRDGMLGKIKI